MNKKQKEKFFNMKLSADGNSANIFIYGEITKWAWEELGEVSSITFKNELDALGDDVQTINLYINSPGGSVFEGLAIGTMLKRHKAKVIAHVDALAASIASVIAMFADEIRMASNSLLMIHNAWTWASGNADQLRKAADDIERINESVIQSYLDKAGDKLNTETLKSLLDAETWLSAEEAFNYGLCDAIDNFNEAAACIEEKLIKQYKNVPQQLLQPQQKVPLEPKQMSDDEKEKRQKIIANSQRNIEYINTIIGGMLK